MYGFDGISFTYIVNSIDLNMEPCGTSIFIVLIVELVSFTVTKNFLSNR